MNEKWKELDDDIREKYIDKAADILDDTLICTRVWEAWSYNTMSQNDFINAYECDDRVEEIAKELYEFVQEESKK